MISQSCQCLFSVILKLQQGADSVCLSFHEIKLQIMFGSTEVNGIAHNGAGKLQWHQSSQVLSKLCLRVFLTMNLRMKINIALVCVRPQANNNKTYLSKVG